MCILIDMCICVNHNSNMFLEITYYELYIGSYFFEIQYIKF